MDTLRIRIEDVTDPDYPWDFTAHLETVEDGEWVATGERADGDSAAEAVAELRTDTRRAKNVPVA